MTILHRRDKFRASQIMAQRAVDHPKINVQWNTKPEKINPDEDGKVKSISILNLDNEERSQIECKGVFIAIGHVPNTEFLNDVLPRDENGYLIPKTNSSVLTSIPGVYVAGDCADHVYRQAITAAGMGCQAAIEAERWLAKKSA